MMTVVASFIASMGSASREQVAASRDAVHASRNQVDGALSSAAVPRGGLGPPAPPLCRCAERTTDLISKRWWLLNGRTLAVAGAGKVADTPPQCAHHGRRPGAWGDWRSGIKEEAAALGRNGGQPRSQSPQVPGRTAVQTQRCTQVQLSGHTKIQTQQSGKFRKTHKP
jgi:hypothetical protein